LNEPTKLGGGILGVDDEPRGCDFMDGVTTVSETVGARHGFWKNENL